MISPLAIPRLETPRLILRGPVESDFPTVAAFMASPRSAFVGGPETDEFALWRAFLAVLGHWALRGYGFFTLEHRDSGALVGRVGIVNHRMWPEPELGWHVFDGFEGQGYAYEAALAVRAWAARDCGLGPLISLIMPGNTRSIALAERLGARQEGEITLMGHVGGIFRHPNLAEPVA